MAIQKLEHIGVQVRNIEASKGFYQGMIGLELLDEFDHPDGDKKLAFLGFNGEILVELIEGYDSDLPTEGKVHHIAFTVKNIEQNSRATQRPQVTMPVAPTPPNATHLRSATIAFTDARQQDGI